MTAASYAYSLRFARNTLWNFLGLTTPLVFALLAIPLLIRGLGTERFALLTLAWVIVGYFSLLDLGLGRALTKLVAEKLAAAQQHEIPPLIWTALAVMAALGILGAALLVAFAPWLTQHALRIPTELQMETQRAFRLLAASVPLVITGAALRGVVEAHQRFDLSAAVRVPMTAFQFFGPVAVLPFTEHVGAVMAVLVLGRLIGLIVYLALCARLVSGLFGGATIQRGTIRPLLRYGSWMTVSNLVGPVMVYLDRFLIGGMISLAAVAYYATPYEVVTKFWVISGAVAGVLFPAFSATFAQDRARAALLLGRGVKWVFLILFPLTVLFVTFSREGLTVWVGAEFAAQSTRVLQWLAVGVFINCLAHVPFALVQAAGRPDWTAKLHLIELPFYLVGVWWLIHARGIEGAAMAWTARVAVDAAILFVMARRLLPECGALPAQAGSCVAIALIVFAIGFIPMSLIAKWLFAVSVLVVFLFVTWAKLFSALA